MSTEPASFGPQTFLDLVRLLEQHPEWRAELRRLVLSDELLHLPALVHDLVEAQRRTEERLDTLAALVHDLVEAQRRTEERLDALAEAQRRTEERLDALAARVDALAEAQRRTEALFQALIGRIDLIETRLGALRGDMLELRYRNHSGSYLNRLLRRPRPVSQDELDDLLEAGAASAALSDDEVQDIRHADIVIRGREQGRDRERYLVVEVSAVIDRHDVERARRRAAALSKFSPAGAVVAGEQVTPDAAADARLGGVWQVLDGRVVAPETASPR